MQKMLQKLFHGMEKSKILKLEFNWTLLIRMNEGKYFNLEC